MNSNWQAITKIWTVISEKLTLWSENLKIDLQEMPRDNNIQRSDLGLMLSQQVRTIYAERESLSLNR